MIMSEYINIVDSAVYNRSFVRSLIRNAYSQDGRYYRFNDCVNTDIIVDTQFGVSGVVGHCECNGVNVEMVKWNKLGIDSKKQNGYVYTNIYIIDGYGEIKIIKYGTHALVAMLKHTDVYDALDELGCNPIPNHINNIPWDNRSENLEWVKVSDNCRHGKIVSSLHHWYGNKFTRNISNCSNKQFIALIQPISCKNIDEYRKKAGKSVFKCGASEYIDYDTMNDFIDWLYGNGIWINYI